MNPSQTQPFIIHASCLAAVQLSEILRASWLQLSRSLSDSSAFQGRIVVYVKTLHS
jgi:hypothetical protein